MQANQLELLRKRSGKRQTTALEQKRFALRDLQMIPGVGKSIAADLNSIGIRKVSDLKYSDPEELYVRSNRLAGVTQDRCLLYVFRCAVYFAATARPQEHKLKWWYWKDKRLPQA